MPDIAASAAAQGAHTRTTLKDSLSSFVTQMNDQWVFRDTRLLTDLRTRLESFGPRDAVDAALIDLGREPARASVADFVAQLGRLSLHYWRPEYSVGQARLLYDDFARDLADTTPFELESGCRAWRMNAKNRFFPTPGQLREAMSREVGLRVAVKRRAEFLLQLLRDESGRFVDDETRRPRVMDARMWAALRNRIGRKDGGGRKDAGKDEGARGGQAGEERAREDRAGEQNAGEQNSGEQNAGEDNASEARAR